MHLAHPAAHELRENVEVLLESCSAVLRCVYNRIVRARHMLRRAVWMQVALECFHVEWCNYMIMTQHCTFVPEPCVSELDPSIDDRDYLPDVVPWEFAR